MGSSLSIVNDSGSDLTCKVGVDEAALSVFGTVFTVLGVLAAVISTAGGAIAPALTLLTAVSSTVKFAGMTAKTILAIATAAKIAGGGISVAETLIKGIKFFHEKQYLDKGYVTIRAGSSRKWDMTLSLWQQGHCIRYREFPTYVLKDEVYMRPIFSGATAGSNIDHRVSFWVAKHGWESPFTMNLQVEGGVQAFQRLEADYKKYVQSDASMFLEQESDIAPPVNFTIPSTVRSPVCKLCKYSETNKMTNPLATANIPGHGNVTCKKVHQAAKRGLISELDCYLVEQFLTPCGCATPPGWN